jgi:hypothetical protein
MRSPNAMLSIRNIGAQLFANQLPFFLDSYKQATAEPFGYLLIDLHAASNLALKLRTQIFKDDEGIVIYLPKSGI